MSGPKSDQAIIASRRSRLLELLAEGKTKTQCAEILQAEGYPASQNTLRLDFNSLMGQWTEANMDSVSEYRCAQLIELAELKAQLVNPAISAVKKVELALAIIDREVDLLGTKAATKTISARIDATGPNYEFLEHSHGLTRGQMEEVFRFMDRLPRQSADIDLSGFEVPDDAA